MNIFDKNIIFVSLMVFGTCYGYWEVDDYWLPESCSSNEIKQGNEIIIQRGDGLISLHLFCKNTIVKIKNKGSMSPMSVVIKNHPYARYPFRVTSTFANRGFFTGTITIRNKILILPRTTIVISNEGNYDDEPDRWIYVDPNIVKKQLIFHTSEGKLTHQSIDKFVDDSTFLRVDKVFPSRDENINEIERSVDLKNDPFGKVVLNGTCTRGWIDIQKYQNNKLIIKKKIVCNTE